MLKKLLLDMEMSMKLYLISYLKGYEIDGYHYKREIQGILKTKVIIGTPKKCLVV